MAINNNTNNNLDKQSSYKRIMLATLLSFVFFVGYDFLYVQPQHALKQKEAEAKQKELQKNTPKPQLSIQDHKTVAPQITTQQTPSNDVPKNKDVVAEEIITTIKTVNNIIEIDRLGRIAQVTLLGKQYINEDGSKIKLFTQNQLRPLEVRFTNNDLNLETFKTNFTASSKTLDATKKITKLTLTQNLSATTLVKNLTIYPNGHYDIEILVSNDETFFITTGFRPDVLADMYADHGALLVLNDNTINLIKDEDLDNTEHFSEIIVASAFDRYYATVLYNTTSGMELSVMPDNDNNPQIFIHGKNSVNLKGYIGPKEYNTLTALDPKLSQVIEYGWFTFIAKPMFQLLQFIHNYIGNWGWTIVIITILIKLVLYPLAYKGMVSMNRLKELSPKVKQIQEKYKGDRQKASMHMMELYKKEGANPMGGCLPMILQIPIFFAIYRVLLNAIELKGAPWILWIEDLALMDPYYILPILMGATMFIQQKITPNQMQDEMQKKMFQFLPLIFTFFFLWFPAGLTLYWFMNNLFTVAQQYYVNKLFEKAKTVRHEEHLEHKHHQGKKK